MVELWLALAITVAFMLGLGVGLLIPYARQAWLSRQQYCKYSPSGEHDFRILHGRSASCMYCSARTPFMEDVARG